MTAGEAADVIDAPDIIIPESALVLGGAVPARRYDEAGSGVAVRIRRTLERPAIASVVGLAFLVAVWWVVSVTLLAHSATVASPSQTVRAVIDSRRLLWEGSRTTLSEAALGFVGGNLVGVGLAIAFVQSKVAQRGVLQLAIVTHCLPVVAVGPLLELLLNGNQPRIVMSALLVFFPTVVTVQVGLRHTDRVALEIVRVYGGKRRHELVLVRLMTALPYVLNALKITAPLAMLGAILGEFLGGNGGLGVLIITSQSQDQLARTWAIALVCTGLSMAAFLFFGLVSRWLVPWGPKSGVRA
jgi:ABC-type nitrate/sulfonate/bicarbonate transport system permease component